MGRKHMSKEDLKTKQDEAECRRRQEWFRQQQELEEQQKEEEENKLQDLEKKEQAQALTPWQRATKS